MKKTITKLFLICLLCSWYSEPEDHHESLRVLDSDNNKLLYENLLKTAHDQFETRRHNVSEAVRNTEGVKEYIKRAKSSYLELINIDGWKKTPLNSKVTGEISCQGYRIEKVIFESQPDHHVTGNLYIPTNRKGPFPAVLECCGHSENGKAYESYQSTGILFALNGYVALVIDTYGQGERLQVMKSDELAEMASTICHALVDVGSMLVGFDIASYQVWDNLRAIDYLCSRPEVDRNKIGVTGNSGGGTQSMYLMGLDPRIKVAAPACGIQTRERMFIHNGPADGCHHHAFEGMRMLEFSDYFILSAPKPVIILAAEQDALLPVDAVSYAFREIKWFYYRLGALDHLDLYTVDLGHGFHKELREGAVWWFNKWLLNKNDMVVEPGLTVQNEDDLKVTKTGQVMKEFEQEKSIVDLNFQLAVDYKKSRKDFWEINSNQACISKIKELMSYKDETETSHCETIYLGSIPRGNYTIQKLLINARDGFPLPALLYMPVESTFVLPAVIYLDENGKNSMVADSIVNNLVRNKMAVLAVDLRGIGETEDDPGDLRKALREWNSDHRISETSLFVGKPLIGQRVADVIDILNFLSSHPRIDKSSIKLIGKGHCGLVALHAAAIDPRISEVKTIRSISSWMDVMAEPMSINHKRDVIPGVLKYYDLPDLINAINPRKVTSIEPVNAYGKIIK